MPLSNLPVAPPTQEPPADPKEDRKPLTICCELLFDGTLNNKKNIQGRLDHEKGQSTKEAKAYVDYRQNKNKEQRLAQGAQPIDLEDDSYENDFSNIVTLEQNLAPTQPDFTDTVIVYTEGAGTVDLEGDRKSGYAFAASISGVKAKVAKGIDDAVAQIGHGPGDEPRPPEEFVIKKLTIDLYGFSRGGSSARYCIHELLRNAGVEAPVPYIKKRLQHLGFEVEEVEVRFVGLFDTVSSYYAAHFFKFLPLENWFVKLQAVRKAQKVVQLASADEHRFHFSLHNIDSAGGKGEQYFLPGVHSDIGGGYAPETTDAGLIVFEGSPDQAAKDRAEYLLAHGWYKPDQLVESVIRSNEAGDPEAVRLTVTREPDKARTISNAYSRIPLKLMGEFAGKNGVNLLSDLGRDATKTINQFPELTKLEATIKSYVGKAGPRGSAATDWHKPHPELSFARYKHRHFSAHYNTFFGYNPRRSLFKRQRQRYEFDG